ncbi:NADP oxidoreductase coenzyme F420-dependent [metagenome]|uniref:NADP oxidoreductase coenzyme F420-dependent n=1 Tax=metagenome TaxID=256318 RepID=A0A2P2C8P4_9ZZZZ
MTTLGLIGAGDIGSAVARLAVPAGYQVVLSNSRGPATLVDLVTELGDPARAGTPCEAAAAGDIVIVTIPFLNYRQVPIEPLRGKVVIDTNNYYSFRDGDFPELDDDSTTSSELLAAHLPESRVVKALNNVYSEFLSDLARPHGDSERSAMPIAGDDVEAKAEVSRLLDAIGWDTVDVGPLCEGWRFQRGTSAYAGPYVEGDPDAWPPTRSRRASVDVVRQRLSEAKRYRDM